MKYFSRIEVSNSDLTWLKNHLRPVEKPDPTEYYNFGTLLDALITEPEKVDFLNFRVLNSDEEYLQFKKSDFDLAEKMKHSFLKDKELRDMLNENAKYQVVDVKNLEINYRGIELNLNMRCKHDIKILNLYGNDIKSTVATTQADFENVCKYFDYDRQTSVYMDISNLDTYMITGISKKNFKVFKVYISKQSKMYKQGKLKYSELANWWFHLFGDNKKMFSEIG